MVTIKEIAKACGVSVATVSNVLNGKGRVGEKTKQKVLDTAKEIGYVPNLLAKNLKQHGTRTIGVITEDLTVFNCVNIVDGINECLDASGYTFILGNLRLYKKFKNAFYHNEGYYREVEKEFQMMQSRRVEGFIYIGAHSRKIKSIPADLKEPIVMAYGYAEEKRIPSVTYDDEQGGFDAASHLIARGHKKIGIIQGESESIHTARRILGYQKALYQNGILYNPDFAMQGDWSRESGYLACEKLYSQGVRAIFSMNDVMAAGVYDFAHENYLQVGKDIALVGFDDREIAKAFNPELATMALPLTEIGKKAAEMVLGMIEKGISLEDTQELVRLKCTFVERPSIGGGLA